MIGVRVGEGEAAEGDLEEVPVALGLGELGDREPLGDALAAGLEPEAVGDALAFGL